MNVEIQPYFAEGERYPALIGVRVEEDEYETAYVSKGELADALTENAKLRELVRDMYRDFVSCDCELILHGRTFMAETRYAHRMRDLGVEVDA